MMVDYETGKMCVEISRDSGESLLFFEHFNAIKESFGSKIDASYD
jgi:hypothetical protein